MKWTVSNEVNGEIVFRLGREGTLLVAEWPDCLRVVVNGAEALEEIAADADPERVAKLRAGPMRAMLRQLGGHMSFHASAVSEDGRALAFLGASGAGKSTFGAQFLGFLRAHPPVDSATYASPALLGDDVALLDRIESSYRVLPAGERHNLDRSACDSLGFTFDEDREKTMVATPIAETSAHLVGLVVLRFGECMNIQRLTGTESVAELVSHVARFVVDDVRLMASELVLLHQLLTQVPLYRLTRPRGFDKVESSLEAAASLLRESAACTDPSP